jgi:hypothetical protein
VAFRRTFIHSRYPPQRIAKHMPESTTIADTMNRPRLRSGPGLFNVTATHQPGVRIFESPEAAND